MKYVDVDVFATVTVRVADDADLSDESVRQLIMEEARQTVLNGDAPSLEAQILGS